MKKITILLLAVVAAFASCTKEEKDKKEDKPYTCASCVTTPEAKSEYDNSSAGVYKGVIVGSTGTIALYLHNTGTEIKAIVVFDGKTATLTNSTLSSWTPGQAIKDAVFTGEVNGVPVEAKFSVDADGKNPKVTVTIPGHNIKVGVYKEVSATLIKGFEGTYSNDLLVLGAFNLTLNGNTYTIVTTTTEPFTGTLSNGGVDVSGEGVEVKGTFNGEEISGTWKNTNNSTQGTWKGKRTL